jgi:Xaa-Pro aminopeptidase
MPPLQRRRRLVGSLAAGVDAALLTDRTNIRWASGFTGSSGALLVARDPDRPALLATDHRYRLRAAEESPDVDLLITRGYAADLLACAGEWGIGVVAVEADHVPVAMFAALQDAAERAGVRLTAVRAVVEPLRARKDDDEIAELTRACAVTDAAFAAVVGRLRPGMTEAAIAWLLTSTIREHGGDGDAFDAIVASGPHAAIPHHRPGDRPLTTGDLLTLDFGARVGGQHADMTRTVVIGSVAPWQAELYALVAAVQASLVAAVRPGAVPVELDRAATDLVGQAGHATAHGLGHGVGLQVHEEPWLVPGSTSPPLVAGVPLTVEPGVYLDGCGGVRIEDTVLVTATGARSLTATPRQLLEL